MKRSTRMMLMSGGRKEDRRDNWEAEDKFRDRRGREHYDNGRFAPMGYDEYPVYDKFRDRRGREHYDNGRYAPRSGMYGPDERSHQGTYYAPRSAETWVYYNDHKHMPRDLYFDENRHWPVNDYMPDRPIGFNRDWGHMGGGADASIPEYREMDRMPGNRAVSGYSSSDMMPHFDRQMAEMWMQGMDNEDGTHGPHWSMDQAKQIMAQRNIDCDPIQFWVTINMIYSDYYKAAKKANANTVDFYAEMAKAFLDDKDAAPDKLSRYYTYIVRH